jgi:hypothetical protein
MEKIVSKLISLKHSFIHLDSQGLENKQPVLFIEDIFSSTNIPENIYFLKNYFFLHYINVDINSDLIQNNSRPFTAIMDGLTELLLAIEEKSIIITYGYTSTLLMYLSVLEPDKMNSIILIHPPAYKENSLSIYSSGIKTFFSGSSGNKPSISSVYHKTLFMKEFLKYMKIVYSQKIRTKSYLIFGETDTDDVPTVLDIHTIFSDYSVIKFDSVFNQLGKEKRFQKVLYSIIKENISTNFLQL